MSLAKARTSSVSVNRLATTTGPKISSLTMRESWAAPAKIVGSMK